MDLDERERRSEQGLREWLERLTEPDPEFVRRFAALPPDVRWKLLHDETERRMRERDEVPGWFAELEDGADDEVYERVNRRVREAVRASGQPEYCVRYAQWDPDTGEAIDNLDDVAVRGRVVLVRPADAYFGGPASRDYRSEEMENPTWLQVAVCANASVLRTNDRHHVFFEYIQSKTWEYKGFDGCVAVVEIVMGS